MTIDLRSKLEHFLYADGDIKKEIIRSNTSKLLYLLLFASGFRIFSIITFIRNKQSATPNELDWLNNLITMHSIFLTILIILLVVTYILHKKSITNVYAYINQYVAIASFLGFGIIITMVDQLVTSNITPFIISCIAVAAVFTIRPIHAIIIYIGGWGLISYLMGLTQADPTVLLSNRVNALSTVVLCIFLVLVLWGSTTTNLRQKQRIEHQRKTLIEQNQELQHLATHDFLTGLYNRRSFVDQLREELKNIKHNGYESCLIMFDIDHFKAINDKYGHPVGDQVLAKLADKLRRILKKTDVIARLGGEEFAIMLTKTSGQQGYQIAETIRKEVSEGFMVNGEQIKITLSLGVAVINQETDTLEIAYGLADKALYVAKQSGKNKTITTNIKGINHAN